MAKRKANGKTHGPMRLYQSYMFRGKDPAIDAFRTVVQDHYGRRNLKKEDYKEIEEQGGVVELK